MLAFDANSAPRAAQSLDEQLDQAAEELIIGDSDDAPLSEKDNHRNAKQATIVRKFALATLGTQKIN